MMGGFAPQLLQNPQNNPMMQRAMIEAYLRKRAANTQQQ